VSTRSSWRPDRAAARLSALRRWAGAALALLLAASCGGGGAKRAPNVLWIVVDGLGAQRLEAMRAAPGAEALTLDALAQRGISFDRAYAAASWSGASLASALSGRLPSGHGVRGAADRLSAEVGLLSEIASQRGVRTGAVISDFRLGAARGFSRGWQEFDSDEALSGAGPTSPGVTSRALAFLQESSRTSEPFLLLAQYSDPRPPFLVHDRARLPSKAPELLSASVDALQPEGVSLDLLQVMGDDATPEERAFIEALCEEDLRATDRAIAQLVAGLRKLGLDKSTWIVVSGGHGLELFEHGWAGDGHGAWEQLVHVPWIVVPPGPRRPARTIPAVVSLCSLAPTLVELLGLPPEAGPGKAPSLASILRGEDLHGEGWAAFQVDYEPASAPPSSPIAHLRGCVSGEWKWIEDLAGGESRLLRLGGDPSETRNVAAEQPQRARQLAERLARACAAVSP
jgi:choline-sulfatase